jgi:hypothetical protein
MPPNALSAPRDLKSQRFIYTPGNGTLYELIVTDLGDGFVLTWTNHPLGGRAATLRWDSMPPAPFYLADKLGIYNGSGDIAPLVDFLTIIRKDG